MGQRGSHAAAGGGEVPLLEQNLAQMPRPHGHVLHANTGRHIGRLRVAGSPREDQGDLQIIDQPVQMIDELARILTAAGVGPVPEIGVNRDMH